MSNQNPANTSSPYQPWEPASLELARAANSVSVSIDDQLDELAASTEQTLELEKLNAREAGFQQGYQEGLAKGLEEGLIQGLQEGQKQAYEDSRPIFLEQKRQIQSLIAHFESDLNHSREAIAADILKLSLEIAQAMIKTSLQVKPELILDLIRHILHTLPMVELPAFLILHPTDAQLVIKQMGEELSESGWKILEDASMQAGGCKIDTASNEMEASLESRWQQIQQTLNQNTDWLV